MPNTPNPTIYYATSKTVQHQYNSRSAYRIHNEHEIFELGLRLPHPILCQTHTQGSCLKRRSPRADVMEELGVEGVCRTAWRVLQHDCNPCDEVIGFNNSRRDIRRHLPHRDGRWD